MKNDYSHMQFRAPTQSERNIIEKRDNVWKEAVADWQKVLLFMIFAAIVNVTRFSCIEGTGQKALWAAMHFAYCFMGYISMNELQTYRKRRRKYEKDYVLVCTCTIIGTKIVPSYIYKPATYIKIQTEYGECPDTWFYLGENVNPRLSYQLLMIRYSAKDCIVTSAPSTLISTQYDIQVKRL